MLFVLNIKMTKPFVRQAPYIYGYEYSMCKTQTRSDVFTCKCSNVMVSPDIFEAWWEAMRTELRADLSTYYKGESCAL